MSNPQAKPAGPPTKHLLALIIWLAVFPPSPSSTSRLATGSGQCPRSCGPLSTPTNAVPVVIYGLMPQLQKIGVRLLTQRANAQDPTEEVPT